MKMKIFALLLVLSLMLSGCHGARERTTFRLPEDLDTSRNFTVTFWAKNDTNINQVNVYKQAIGEFEALYPNITVEMRLYTDYGRIYNDVITNISTGTTPNVCIPTPTTLQPTSPAKTWWFPWMTCSPMKAMAWAEKR